LEGPAVTDLRETIPTMTDDALKTLRANAERLVSGGSEKQKTAAQELLPALDNELAQRKATKVAELAARAVARKRKA
jgi:hypothetical protein